MEFIWLDGLILGLTIIIYNIVSEKFWPDRNRFLSGLISAFLVIIVYLLLKFF